TSGGHGGLKGCLTVGRPPGDQDRPGVFQAGVYMAASLSNASATQKRRPIVLFSRLEYYDRSCYCQAMSATSTQKTSPVGDEPPPSKGQASRATILLTAAKLATTKGLDGLSIGDLAAEVGMSKSGLYAHFKSKEELELATIETAAAIFDSEVLQPAARAQAGTERLGALVDAFLSHLERKVYPGGCFFAGVGAGLRTRPRPAAGRAAGGPGNGSDLFGRWILVLDGARSVP